MPVLWLLLLALASTPTGVREGGPLEATLGRAATAEDPLVIVLHGRGAGPESMLARLQVSGFRTPCRVLLLRGPHAAGGGHAWFSRRLTDMTPEERVAEADVQAGRLVEMLEALRRGDPAGRPPILAGYSQGGVIALAVRDRRPDLVGGVVVAATWLPPSRMVAGTGAPPIRLVHGARDGRLPLREVRRATGELRATGHDVSVRVLPREGHRFGRDLWRAWLDQLGRTLAEVGAPR